MDQELHDQMLAAITEWHQANREAIPLVGHPVITHQQHQHYLRVAYRLNEAEDALRELAARIDALP